MMWNGTTRGKCSLTWNIPDSSRKLGRSNPENASSDCPTSAHNYLMASNQEVLTSSTHPFLLFSKKPAQSLGRTLLVPCLPMKASNKSLIEPPARRSDECIDATILGTSA